ncbi:MAG TPA: hypothetical protein VJ822_01055 [Dongiaceae bacterium]|nr:hypothetical protein [Dongiaceae bacterium]
MRTNIVMLAVLAGLGLSSFGAMPAEARNLSCITGISPGEQRLLRDCEPKPEAEIYTVIEVLNDAPPPPPEPARIKHGESGKGSGVQGSRDHDAPAGGGDPGPSF